MQIRLATFIITIAGICTLSGLAWAAPSPRLPAAFTKPCAAISIEKSDLTTAVKAVLVGASTRFFVGVEYCDWIDNGKLRDFHAKPGTLKEQLDELANSARFVWDCDGEWLNFWPKAADIDPDYVLNKRRAGKITISLAVCDPGEKEWLDTNHVQFTRAFSGLSQDYKIDYDKIHNNAISLSDATLRTRYNARMSLYGIDSYTLSIKHVPDPKNTGNTITWIKEHSANLWEKPPAPGGRSSAESGSEAQTSKPDATSWKSIDDLPANIRSHVDALYAARSRKFTALDGKIEKFSVSKLTVPEAVAELSNQANVICGIEVVSWQSSPTELKSVVLPQVSLSVENTTPRRILDKLISLDQTFVWGEDSGIANVVMRSAYNSPAYPFNLTIDEFSVAGSPYSNAFIGEPHVWGLFQLPQVSPALPIGMSGKWPTKFEPQVTLDAHGACVRKIVNEVARQVGMSWSLVWHDAPRSTPGKSGAMFWMIPKVWVGLSADWKGTGADEAQLRIP